MLRTHVIKAVFRRNVQSYFSGILGYLFIVVFVSASSLAAFNSRFFTANIATFDQLNAWFPYLLLGFIPAITMSVWADEKKLGTDELLFTLPASDVEILLGKYLAVLSVYTIALAFSLTNVIVLCYYGDPDASVIFANYVGYFLAGAALLACGMFSSVLTSSTTVAFVYGALFCAIPIFVGELSGLVNSIFGICERLFGMSEAPFDASAMFNAISLPEQLRQFGLGVVPMSGLIYYLSLAAFMLYLNLIMISKRHWQSGAAGTSMGFQYAGRAISLSIILVSSNVVIANAGNVANLQADMTSENIYSLTDTTLDLIDKIDPDKPVTIQAFLSEDVPGEYADHAQRLRGLLRQYNQIGGSRLAVRFVNVEPYSDEAEEARGFGIAPQLVQSDRDGRRSQQEVYLGAVVDSSSDQVIIPFFDLGTSIEYELTRSIRTASSEERLTVGILKTDANVMGGFDMSSFRSLPEWQIATELKKQYTVEEVDPNSPIDGEKYDVLMAVLPSSLTQPQMQNFVKYVESGKSVLVFDDPLPLISGGMIQHAPRQPKPSQGGGMMGRQPPPEPKADEGKLTTLLNILGIVWENGTVVFDRTGEALHPDIAELIQPELVFISPKGLSSKKNAENNAFNPESEISNGLQELLAIYAGRIQPLQSRRDEFQSLLRTSADSGLHEWEEITQRINNPFGGGGGITIASRPTRTTDDEAHVLAAHITRDASGEKPGLNVVFVADVDLISDQMFSIVATQMAGLKLDNVRFVLNAVDLLAGDDAFVALRRRRAKHRILTRIQDRQDEFRRQREKAVQEAEEEAEESLETAQKRLDEAVERIRNNEALSDNDKAQQIATAQRNEQNRLNVITSEIDRKKAQVLEQEANKEKQQIQELESEFRFWSLMLPPLPAIFLGLGVLGMQLRREQREIDPRRLV